MTAYTFATLSGSDYGGSTDRKRAHEAAARICRETGEVVVVDEPGCRWQLTPRGGRASWTKITKKDNGHEQVA